MQDSDDTRAADALRDLVSLLLQPTGSDVRGPLYLDQINQAAEDSEKGVTIKPIIRISHTAALTTDSRPAY